MFGTSPRTSRLCERAATPRDASSTSRALRSIMSTGSILHDEQYDWVARQGRRRFRCSRSPAAPTSSAASCSATRTCRSSRARRSAAASAWTCARARRRAESRRRRAGLRATVPVPAAGLVRRRRRAAVPRRVFRPAPRGLDARRPDRDHRARHRADARPLGRGDERAWHPDRPRGDVPRARIVRGDRRGDGGRAADARGTRRTRGWCCWW